MQKQLFWGGFILTLLLTWVLPVRAQNVESPTDSSTLEQEETLPESEVKEEPSVESSPDSNMGEDSTTEVSSEEIEKFANAISQIQTIQTDYQTRIIQAIEQQGLTQERFIQIQQAQLNPEVQPEPEVSSEEMDDFDQANTKVDSLSQEAKSKMQEAVRAEGLELERFNEIFASLQGNPELQQEVQRILKN